MRGAWRSLRTEIANDGGGCLYFDERARERQRANGHEGAGGMIVAAIPCLTAQLREAFEIAGIGDVDRHRRHVGEAASCLAQRCIDQAEDRAHLRIELAANVLARGIDERGLARKE